MKKQLVFLSGSRSGEEIILTPGDLTIGRAPENSVRVGDATISRRHALVQVTESAVTITDLQSSHGTLVNGQRISAATSLQAGDVVQLGLEKLLYSELADEENPRPVPPGPTKFLKPEELQGLALVQRKNWRRLGLVAGAAGVFVIAACCVGLMDGESSEELVTYRQTSQRFTIAVPHSWSVSGLGGDLVSWQGHPSLNLTVQVQVNSNYLQTGLWPAFRDYLTKKSLELRECRSVEWHGLRAILFTALDDRSFSRGLFLLHGERRMVIVGSGRRQDYPQAERYVMGILRSFSLTERQVVLDFPEPDRAMAKLALTKPEQVLVLAEKHYRLGMWFLGHPQVRADNLFRARREFQKALQWLSAYQQDTAAGQNLYLASVRGLRQAEGAFDRAVQQRRVGIKAAWRRGDKETAYWQAYSLWQMVPDRGLDVAQEAKRWLDKLGRERERKKS